MFKRLIPVCMCLLVIFFANPSLAEKGKQIKIGDEIPTFFLKDIHGNDFFLKDYVGEKPTKNFKGIILSFCASWCKPCKEEIPELEKLLDKYKDKGLLIYLIDLEKEELAQKFIDETKTSLPVLIDKYLVVQKLFGFNGIPYTVLVNSEGKVTYINTAFSQKRAAEIMKGFELAVMDVLGIDSGNSAQ